MMLCCLVYYLLPSYFPLIHPSVTITVSVACRGGIQKAGRGRQAGSVPGFPGHNHSVKSKNLPGVLLGLQIPEGNLESQPIFQVMKRLLLRQAISFNTMR
ncbi:hypothetical protein J6590_075620 [Homalodisca vitripennis]|nr:hypothetical protein J6590_075620 [Homalodisca vitripennis]